jgi:anthranilate phosphoribosyltransferase
MTSTELDQREMLNNLIAGVDLEPAAVEQIFGAVMDGRLEQPVVAALLVALRMKGETGAEVAAAARAMRARAVPVPVRAVEQAIDTCGTGGDGANTVNISTAAALVAAAAGVPVAKHGNRSVSSSCGSADVLEAAGVCLALPAPELATLIDEVGIGFLFAPNLHPAMREVMPVRRCLGIRTTFNLLGPLTNPAGVRRQVVGVWGEEIQELVAAALAALGSVHALVVHSADGLDELSVLAPSTIYEVRDGEVTGTWQVTPDRLGITADDPEALRGGDVAHNSERLQVILAGAERSAASEAVALNAGAALYVAGVADSLEDGLSRARAVLHSGAAGERLQVLARRSQELAGDE